MNVRNLGCWAIVIVVYVLLVAWGSSQPISTQRAPRSALARLWRRIESAPISGQRPTEPPPAKLPPPAPPKLVTAEGAEHTIRVSVFADQADELVGRLRRSIRLSPWPVDALDELELGASRMAGPADLPAGSEWPLMEAEPLTLLAQIRLADVAPLDEDGLLPPTGWLCFFYADALKPPATGLVPEDRGAWRVEYFDADVATLERVSPPESVRDKYPPCAVQFWPEWTLPALAEEPELIRNPERLSYYSDLCAALTGRPEVSGWHHLAGYAQNLAGPMRPACAAASQGVAVTPETDLSAAEYRAKTAQAKEWVLLFQVDLDALETLDPYAAPTAQPEWRAFSSGGDRLYFWVRRADLRVADFSRVWIQRQGYFEDEDEYYDDEYEFEDDGGDD